MLRQFVRLLPFILAGLLLLNLVTAIAAGGRANWLAVAFVALLLALMLFRRTRVASPDNVGKRQPSTGPARSAPGEVPATAPPRAPPAPSSKSRRWWFGRRR
jgi:hypothetical protein